MKASVPATYTSSRHEGEVHHLPFSQPRVDARRADHIAPKPGRAGFVLALVSGGIDTFIEELIPGAHHFFDYICINRLTYDNHGIVRDVLPTPYDFAGKLAAIDEIRHIWRVRREECVFVSENHNDIPVMKAVGLSIAYPAREWGGHRRHG
jgi:phosphoserine phosphatase